MGEEMNKIIKGLIHPTSIFSSALFMSITIFVVGKLNTSTSRVAFGLILFMASLLYSLCFIGFLFPFLQHISDEKDKGDLK